MQTAVRVRNLRFRYRTADRDALVIPVLDISNRGLVALTGPSGAGKSTLIELLAGTLREPYEGSAIVLGTELRDLRRDADRQRHVRRIGLIPQDYGLLPGITLEALLLQDLADAQVDQHQRKARAREAIRKVELAGFEHRLTNQLSGGQRQRVAIARMLARDVQMIVADEPTANLDRDLIEETMRLLRELASDVLVILVTHDGAVAAMCDRTVVLQPPSVNSSGPIQPSTRLKLRLPILVPTMAAILVAVTVSSVLWSGGFGGPPKAANSRPGPSPSTVVMPSGGQQPISAPTPALAPRQPSVPTVAPSPAPQSTPPAPNLVGWWHCESDQTDSGIVDRNSDTLIRAQGGVDSAYCDQAMKAKGVDRSAWVFRVPNPGGPSVIPYQHCGGLVANIVGLSPQVAPWYLPMSEQAGFDQNWNLVNLGMCQ